jgi:hypothetical protein
LLLKGKAFIDLAIKMPRRTHAIRYSSIKVYWFVITPAVPIVTIINIGQKYLGFRATIAITAKPIITNAAR